MSRRTITITTPDGIQTPVEVSGSSERSEAVVCLHGNPGSSEDWELLYSPVSAFAPIVAPDMPGFGRGARPEGFSHTVDGYATHLEQLLAALEIDRVHLVLHDFGGFWGLRWASQHPDRLASLTLVNVGALPDYRWHKLARIWRAPLFGELFMAATTAWTLRVLLEFDNPKPLPPEFVQRTVGFMDSKFAAAVLALYRDTSDPAGVTCADARVLTPKRIPTLVVWGEDDAYLPVEWAERQREFFDVQGMHRLPQCGHWPMLDEGETFSRLITDFLRTQVGSPVPTGS